MKVVTVRNKKIGEGIPKICVPIVEKTREAIIGEAEEFDSLPIDMVEWRADWYDRVSDADMVVETLSRLRDTLGNLPLLFTYRTAKEGGARSISEKEYETLSLAVIRSKQADLVDVEAFMGETVVKNLIQEAREAGVKVILSNHDFIKTPEKEEIIEKLIYMQELGADIAKIAVMPQSRGDVLTLMAATSEMKEKHAKIPIVTMSMAQEGIISRLSGEIFGSAMTFGAAKKASAPGQISVEDLSRILKLLHKNYLR